MGGIFNHKKYSDCLNVADLNYSGASQSPFEFYNQEYKHLQKKFDHHFRHFLYNYKKLEKHSKFKNIKIEKYDLYLKDRYCPLYKTDCGVKDGQLTYQHQFYIEWEKYWDKKSLDSRLRSLIKKQSKIYWSEDSQKLNYIKEYLRELDFLLYKSIVLSLYDQFENFETIIKKRASILYLNFMEAFYMMPFLDEQVKARKLVQFLHQNDIDVMFLQMTTQTLYTHIEKMTDKYRIIRGRKFEYNHSSEADVGILLNPSKFKHAYSPKKSNMIFDKILNGQTMPLQHKKKYLLWGKAAIISIDNFLFLSVHPGKIEQFSEIAQYIQKDIQILQNKFPKKYIVIGAMNFLFHHIHSQKLNIHSYPNSSHLVYTTYKKRTMMQFQFSKGSKTQLQKTQEAHLKKGSYWQSTSKIIYDKRLQVEPQSETHKQKYKLQGVYEASSKQATKTKIPRSDHPFNHFIVMKKLFIPVKKPSLNHEEYQNFGFQTSSSSQEDPLDKVSSEENPLSRKQLQTHQQIEKNQQGPKIDYCQIILECCQSNTERLIAKKVSRTCEDILMF